jgi:hypothetical protein
MSLDSPTLDPAQLAAFRQQAGPIVARERGMTPACRIKLAGVARAVGIAEEQIDAAVRSLGASEPDAPPNPQAERFRRRLQKDLSGKTTTILGPIIEEQILASAARKYGLDEASARQVVAEVAAELGLTRITTGDAVAGLTVQIDAVVRDSTWLAREAWDRLRDAGDKWGIELSVVEALIDERLEANRQAIAARRRRSALVLALAGGSVVLTVAIVSVLALSRASHRGPSAEAPPASALTSKRQSAQPPAQPAWWDVDLALEMASARSQLAGLSGACDLMASPNADERAAGYERMIGQVHGPLVSDSRNIVGAIAAGCLGLEPEESAAARLQAAVFNLFPSGATSLDRQPTLAQSCWAADVVAQALVHPGASAGRKQSLAAAGEAALGGPVDPTKSPGELPRLLRGRAVLATYQRLTTAAAKEPAAVAARFPPLPAAAADLLPEPEWLQAETALLAAALPAAGAHWKPYEAAMGRCISAADPLPALKLAETLRRTTDEALARQLSEQLILRAGVQPKSWSKSDVALAVRKGLGGVSLAAATANDRWQSLREHAASVLAQSGQPADNPRTLLAHTVELAHWTNLAMALAQGEAGFVAFDAAIGQPPTIESQAVAALAQEPAAATSPRRGRPSGASQQRELNRLIEALSNRIPSRQVPRESALRALAELTEQTPSLTPRQAEDLASYLLAAKPAEELANVLPQLARLRVWQELRLAVADGLAQSKLPHEALRELVAALVAQTLPAETTAIASLRRALLQDVLHEAEAATELHPAPQPGGRGEFADRAAEQLRLTYLARARLLNVAAATAGSVADALELSLAKLTESDLERSRLDSARQAARYLANDDLHLTVAWQALLIEASARRALHERPERGAAARQLAAESLAAAPPSVLAQLRDQERTLLQLWMLYAPEF